MFSTCSYEDVFKFEFEKKDCGLLKIFLDALFVHPYGVWLRLNNASFISVNYPSEFGLDQLVFVYLCLCLFCSVPKPCELPLETTL